MLSKIKISQKVYLLGFSLFSLIILMGGIGYTQMEKIGEELYNIAEEDIPVSKQLTLLTGHHLEEGILFERTLRIILEAKVTHHDDSAHLAEVRRDFDKLVGKSTEDFSKLTTLTVFPINFLLTSSLAKFISV
mgnify:CR=1 FL=1